MWSSLPKNGGEEQMNPNVKKKKEKESPDKRLIIDRIPHPQNG
jgi:hypothetical protein